MEGGPGDALMKRLRLIRPELGAASARTAIILAAIILFALSSVVSAAIASRILFSGARLEDFEVT